MGVVPIYMNKNHNIFRLLKKKILMLDGATGTELQKRGMPAGVCPEAWCLENPKAIRDIHAIYRKAGSDIIYTCTFGANRLKLGLYGIENVREVNKQLALLARDAAGNQALIAGDIGPTGHFVEPFGDLKFEAAIDIFKEQVVGLLDGGVDLFVIETMMDIQEARAALLAVKELTDCFTMVTMTYENNGRTLSGTDPVTALITLQSLGADAVGCNCSTGPDTMATFIKTMKPYATVPLVAKPNAGMPKLSGDKTVFDMDPRAFASFGRQFAAAGVNLMGGCCGTTPEHIRALKKALSDTVAIPPSRKSIGAVSSARRVKILDSLNPLCIVGERINPTGKKPLQQELLQGKMTLIRQLAKEQERQGADLLDVNIGVPGIDEMSTIKSVISLLSASTDLPLVIDSSRIETIEAALRIYPGRALINSISGEAEKINKLLPVAVKYGAMFILLPLTDREMPDTADRRKTIIKNIFREAKKLGFSKEDIVVDGLVMTVASNPRAAEEALKTVAWCTGQFKVKTILGLSNVSFGMPARKWMNATFLAMAQSMGLTMAIANPADEELMSVKMAGDVFMQKDQDASSYIRHFSAPSTGDKIGLPAKKLSPSQIVHEAIMEGNREDIVTLVEKAITSGVNPSKLVDDVMIPAIVSVGELFDQKAYFLPQLIASAEAMKKALEYLDPKLRREKTGVAEKGIIILATVKGDVHDIGKNIVALMLKNHGYKVFDLGKDIPAKDIVEAMKKNQPDIVGLSALMTTTMVNMKEVIELAGREAPACPFIVGGAVVTESYASSIGAAYARDGVETVRVVERMLKSKKYT
jgi:5-methyltetrahydrofolate--homocysteine methyltransferase